MLTLITKEGIHTHIHRC